MDRLVVDYFLSLDRRHNMKFPADWPHDKQYECAKAAWLQAQNELRERYGATWRTAKTPHGVLVEPHVTNRRFEQLMKRGMT